MFNLLVALMLAVIAPLCVGAAGRVPDFDYPKTVMKDADKSLDRALQKGNHADVVKYLVQSTLAEAQISSDNIPGILGKIDSVAAIETDSAAVGLMHYLKAVVYSSHFSNNSYAISQRKPVDGRAADMSEWTQADFIGAVTECLGRSLEYADALWATPVTDYVETDELSAAVYPTLLDMVTYRGIDALNLVASYRWTGIALDAREQADKFKAEGNVEKAVLYYTKAAEKGDARAQFVLSLCYNDGYGVDPDEERSMYWLNLSLEQEYALAQNFRGVVYTYHKENSDYGHRRR